MNTQRLGRNFDDFLQEEGLLNEVEVAAIKRVIAYQIEQEMARNHLTKTDMAKRMKTSRASFEKLLDPTNTLVTLHILGKAATVLGKKLRIELT